jgi:hypothetical protein
VINLSSMKHPITLTIFLLFIILPAFLFATPPAGYYPSLNGKSSAALKTALHNILMQDTTRFLSYGAGVNSTWYGFYTTDRDTITNLVLDMYSAIRRYFSPEYVQLNYPSFGQQLHIEHSLPKSWWSCHEWAAYKDLNHWFPADGSTNISKSDKPLATAYKHYKNVWNSTKPENMMENNSYPVFKEWAINLLLQWSRQDPVSDKERKRNEKVFLIQGNRNPFIDYPELVEYIWGDSVGCVIRCK